MRLQEQRKIHVHLVVRLMVKLKTIIYVSIPMMVVIYLKATKHHTVTAVQLIIIPMRIYIFEMQPMIIIMMKMDNQRLLQMVMITMALMMKMLTV